MKYLLLLLFLPSLASERDLLQSGPMLGHIDLVEASIWLQTTEPADVKLQYWREGGERQESETIRTSPDNWHAALFVLSHLDYGATYSYSVWINGRKQHFDYPLTFKTQAFWQYRTEPPPVKFVMGSCFFVNEETYDRPGKPYGDEFEIFDVILDQKPDAMFWLGDNVYFREPDFNSKAMMAHRYTQMRAYEQIQPLWAAMSHYATWDDHDFGPNDSNKSYHLKGEALRLFKGFWANPSYGLPETPGVFTLVQLADLDFFILDDRYHRASNRLRDPDKPYLGEAQLDWLKNALTTSRASFKFVVNGNQIINVNSGHETWFKFTNEWKNFMEWLHDADVRGLVFLSGDRHFSELLKYDRENRYPLYEFTSSPLTSGVSSRLGDETKNPLRVEGTLVNDRRNFGVIKVTGDRNDRTLVMETIDSTGKLRWSHKLHQYDLGYRKRTK